MEFGAHADIVLLSFTARPFVTHLVKGICRCCVCREGEDSRTERNLFRDQGDQLSTKSLNFWGFDSSARNNRSCQRDHPVPVHPGLWQDSNQPGNKSHGRVLYFFLCIFWHGCESTSLREWRIAGIGFWFGYGSRACYFSHTSNMKTKLTTLSYCTFNITSVEFLLNNEWGGGVQQFKL